MTISEIINKLQKIKNEFGNVNVNSLNVSNNIGIHSTSHLAISDI